VNERLSSDEVWWSEVEWSGVVLETGQLRGGRGRVRAELRKGGDERNGLNDRGGYDQRILPALH